MWDPWGEGVGQNVLLQGSLFQGDSKPVTLSAPYYWQLNSTPRATVLLPFFLSVNKEWDSEA